jgi:hypothetical protein
MATRGSPPGGMESSSRTAQPPGTSAPGDTTSAGLADKATVDKVQDAMGQVADQAQDKFGQLTEQARQQAKSQVGSQLDQAGEGLAHVAQAVTAVGRELREQDQAGLAQYTDQAAEQLDRLAGYLRTNDIDQVINQVQRFARRKPALFLGSTFVAGLLGARFLKTSSAAANAPARYAGQGSTPGSGRALGQPQSASGAGLRGGNPPQVTGSPTGGAAAAPNPAFRPSASPTTPGASAAPSTAGAAPKPPTTPPRGATGG